MIVLILKIIFVVVCLFLIGIVLIQRARGGGLAGAFGGAGSETFMGNLQNKEIVRYTTYLAAAFFFLAVAIDFVPQNRGTQGVEELGGGVAPISVPADGEAEGDVDMEPVDIDEDMPISVDPAAQSGQEGQ